MVVLNKENLRKFILERNLIKNYINLDKQLTPNGFDLTVEAIFEFSSWGALDFSNSQRVVPQGRSILPKKAKPEDKFGWWELKPGGYKVRTNEVINLPLNLIALAYPRTSLLRMGAFVQNGVWDAGFKGKGEFILVVENSYGVRIKENARIVQLVFLKIEPTEPYSGIYQDLK